MPILPSLMKSSTNLLKTYPWNIWAATTELLEHNLNDIGKNVTMRDTPLLSSPLLCHPRLVWLTGHPGWSHLVFCSLQKYKYWLANDLSIHLPVIKTYFMFHAVRQQTNKKKAILMTKARYKRCVFQDLRVSLATAAARSPQISTRYKGRVMIQTLWKHYL